MVLLLSFQHPDPFKDQKDKDHVKDMVDAVIVELPGTDHKVDVLAHLEDASGDENDDPRQIPAVAPVFSDRLEQHRNDMDHIDETIYRKKSECIRMV